MPTSAKECKGQHRRTQEKPSPIAQMTPLIDASGKHNRLVILGFAKTAPDWADLYDRPSPARFTTGRNWVKL